MNQMLRNAMLVVCTIGQKVLNETEYNLIIVEEEAVPLAAGDIVVGNHLVPITLLVMGLLFIITISLSYCSKCRQYRRRIQMLCRDGVLIQTGWNLKRLRETVCELEWKMSGEQSV